MPLTWWLVAGIRKGNKSNPTPGWMNSVILIWGLYKQEILKDKQFWGRSILLDCPISLSQSRVCITHNGNFPLLSPHPPPATALFFSYTPVPKFCKEQIHWLPQIAHFPFVHQPSPTDFLQLLSLNVLQSRSRMTFMLPNLLDNFLIWFYCNINTVDDPSSLKLSSLHLLGCHTLLDVSFTLGYSVTASFVAMTSQALRRTAMTTSLLSLPTWSHLFSQLQMPSGFVEI